MKKIEFYLLLSSLYRYGKKLKKYFFIRFSQENFPISRIHTKESHRPKRTLIPYGKTGERLPHSSIRESSRNSATFTRENQDPRLDF